MLHHGSPAHCIDQHKKGVVLFLKLEHVKMSDIDWPLECPKANWKSTVFPCPRGGKACNPLGCWLSCF